MTKQQFLAQRDPNRITLEDVFRPGDGVVFTTPLVDISNFRKVFMEAAPEIIDFLYVHLKQRLISTESSCGHLGIWDNLVPENDQELVILYKPTSCAPESNIALLTQILYMDLAMNCNFMLSNLSIVSVVQDKIEIVRSLVCLPPDIPNGSLEIPIVLPPRKLFLT